MDDLEIEDIFSNYEKNKNKKKNTSKKKGNSGERDLANHLNKRFEGHEFYRVLGSGNRFSHVGSLGDNKNAFIGDIVTPVKFNFTIEVKYGYPDVEIGKCFNESNKKIDDWLLQAKKDAERNGKKYLLCWRKPHREWLAFVDEKEELKINYSFKMFYKSTIIISLQNILKEDNSFWFMKE